MTTALTLAPLYARSLIKRAGDLDHWPSLSSSESCITIDRKHLMAYRKVTGVKGPADKLPPLYLQVLAFEPVMHMLTDARFPLKLLGLVHVSNRIRQWSPIHVQDVLAMQVRLGALNTTHRGYEFEVEMDVTRAGRTVWSAHMGVLSRARTGLPRPESQTQAPPDWTCWHDLGPVPEDTGRRYAKVSGDFNPIHLSALSARVFGFPRAIAHGMWTLARGLSALDPHRFDSPYELDVKFRKPLFLPSPGLWLALADENEGAVTRLAIMDANRETLHLTGTLRATETDTPNPAR